MPGPQRDQFPERWPSPQPGSPLEDGELPLPDPYPEYVACPHCAEPEVEVWCYQTRVICHNCSQWIEHTPAEHCRIAPFCHPVSD